MKSLLILFVALLAIGSSNPILSDGQQDIQLENANHQQTPHVTHNPAQIGIRNEELALDNTRYVSRNRASEHMLLLLFLFNGVCALAFGIYNESLVLQPASELWRALLETLGAGILIMIFQLSAVATTWREVVLQNRMERILHPNSVYNHRIGHPSVLHFIRLHQSVFTQLALTAINSCVWYLSGIAIRGWITKPPLKWTLVFSIGIVTLAIINTILGSLRISKHERDIFRRLRDSIPRSRRSSFARV